MEKNILENAVKEALLNEGSQHVYSEFLLDSDVWFFRQKSKNGDHYEKYDRFRKFFSRRLQLPQNNIAIVGSAKLGFSLSPKKPFKKFDTNSDIDIAIVSEDLFRKSWNAFLEIQSKYYLENYKYITSDIFRRFVSLKKIDIRSNFFVEWAKIVEPCKKDLQLIFHMENEINYRIYESWEAVERYHCTGMDDLIQKIASKNEH